jgi:osmotically-inducible protein OsmY
MKTNRISFCLAWCLLFPTIAVSLTGCASGRYQRNADIDDDTIASRVAAALARDREYKFEDVTIASHQGKVQLSGVVPTGDEKSEAEDITERVRGVKGVENKISVTP